MIDHDRFWWRGGSISEYEIIKKNFGNKNIMTFLASHNWNWYYIHKKDLLCWKCVNNKSMITSYFRQFRL